MARRDHRCDGGCRRPPLTLWVRVPDPDPLTPLTADPLPAIELCGVCSDRHALALVADMWCQTRDARVPTHDQSDTATPAP